MTVLFNKAKIISMQMRNSHADISLFAVLNGFLVEISNPAKKDCEIPM